MAEFILGDVVKLKSGGPAMTVAAINDVDIRALRYDGSRIVLEMFPSAKLLRKLTSAEEEELMDA